MPLVEVRNLVKHFERGGGLFREKSIVRAVDDVSFSVEEGETFALVGESGSGKSTTGRCMLRLIEPTSGEVTFRGENVLAFSSGHIIRMIAARWLGQQPAAGRFYSCHPASVSVLGFEHDSPKEPIIRSWNYVGEPRE